MLLAGGDTCLGLGTGVTTSGAGADFHDIGTGGEIDLALGGERMILLDRSSGDVGDRGNGGSAFIGTFCSSGGSGGG